MFEDLSSDLDLFIHVSFQLHGEHTVLHPFRHITISVLPGTHSHLSQVKHMRMKYLAEGHNIETKTTWSVIDIRKSFSNIKISFINIRK